jgi:hypothetical protein
MSAVRNSPHKALGRPRGSSVVAPHRISIRFRRATALVADVSSFDMAAFSIAMLLPRSGMFLQCDRAASVPANFHEHGMFRDYRENI